MEALTLTKKYEKYPKYKDSGIDWVGNIPQTWDRLPLKALFRRVKKTRNENEKLLSVYRDYGVIEKSSRDDNFNKESEDLSFYQLVSPGDLVTNKMKTWQGSIAVSRVRGIVSPAYYVMAPLTKQNPAYFHYLLRSGRYIAHYENISKGIRVNQWDLDYLQFKNSSVLIPSPTDQEKIAKYLDQKTAATDAIIEKKQKQIELLKEKKVSYIDDAIERLKGKVYKIKNVALVNPPKGIMTSGPDSLVSFVPMEAISEEGELSLQEKKYSEVKDGFTHFQNNDVVLAKITPCFENGKAGVMRDLKNGFGFGTTEFIVIRPSKKVLAEYLYFIVYSNKFRKNGEVGMKGTAGQKRVTNEYVRNYEIKVPDVDEQKIIIEKLQRRLRRFDEALNQIEVSISLIQEFKSSIISHAVTGKIRI